MSYEKQEWVAQTTVISAARMNHIENGIETVDTAISNEADVRSTAVDDVLDRLDAANAAIDSLKAENTRLYTVLNNVMDVLPQGEIGPAAVVNCTDATNANPRELSVAFSASQSGTGDPSPENIRPIIGMTECTINQYNQTSTPFDIPDHDEGVIKVINGNHLIINGVDSMAPVTQIGLNTPITIPSGQTAHIKFLTNQSIIGPAKVILYAERFTEIANGNLGDEISFTAGETITISSIAFSLYREGNPPPSATYDIDGYLYLLYGENELVSATYPISWENKAGTAYGGVLDVINGTLTVTHKKLAINADTVDVGTFREGPNGNRCGFEVTKSFAITGNMGSGFLCNIAKPDSSANAGTPSYWTPYTCALYYGGSEQRRQFYFRYVFPKTVTTDTDAFNYLTTNGCEITYPLTEPVVYHINPVSIKLAQGANSIMTDVGEITLRYFKVLE